MTEDTLKIHQNEDGSFSIEWDEKDPKWSFHEWVDKQGNPGYCD